MAGASCPPSRRICLPCGASASSVTPMPAGSLLLPRPHPFLAGFALASCFFRHPLCLPSAVLSPSLPSVPAPPAGCSRLPFASRLPAVRWASGPSARSPTSLLPLLAPSPALPLLLHRGCLDACGSPLLLPDLTLPPRISGACSLSPIPLGPPLLPAGLLSPHRSTLPFLSAGAAPPRALLAAPLFLAAPCGVCGCSFGLGFLCAWVLRGPRLLCLLAPPFSGLFPRFFVPPCRSSFWFPALASVPAAASWPRAPPASAPPSSCGRLPSAPTRRSLFCLAPSMAPRRLISTLAPPPPPLLVLRSLGAVPGLASSLPCFRARLCLSPSPLLSPCGRLFCTSLSFFAPAIAAAPPLPKSYLATTGCPSFLPRYFCHAALYIILRRRPCSRRPGVLVRHFLPPLPPRSFSRPFGSGLGPPSGAPLGGWLSSCGWPLFRSRWYSATCPSPPVTSLVCPSFLMRLRLGSPLLFLLALTASLVSWRGSSSPCVLPCSLPRATRSAALPPSWRPDLLSPVPRVRAARFGHRFPRVRRSPPHPARLMDVISARYAPNPSGYWH